MIDFKKNSNLEIEKIFIFLIIVISILSCRDDDKKILDFPVLNEVPIGFPDIEFPDENQFTKARWDLGKKLFYDPILSEDNKISCASCHKSELAFSDNVALSIGANSLVGRRNSPSLANIGYHPYFTREGGLSTLEMQILVPIQEHDEFNNNIVIIADLLAKDPIYIEMAQAAYQRNPDPYVITRAISTFERTLISGNSRYDQFFYQNIDDALNKSEQRGMDLFFSERSNCSACHNGFNFTNYAFENNGLYEEYPDSGRFRLTGQAADIGVFKVASLRNIELTAPYMHDGSLKTLDEVINHYNSGGKSHDNKSAVLKPLNLTNKEKGDLKAFLLSLTDETFIKNPIFKP